MQSFLQQEAASRSPEQMEDVLDKLGLQDLNLKACEFSDLWKENLLQLVESYETVFSRDKMDRGEATDCPQDKPCGQQAFLPAILLSASKPV